jgi:hypothetical protein
MTPRQAAAEILRRQRARHSLIGFAQGIEIPGKPVANDGGKSDWDTDATELIAPTIETGIADLHILMMKELEACIRKDDGRLMLFFAPGCAKSTYSDIVAPTWAMGMWPGFRVILASYASTIAIKQARKARAICRSPLYQSIWHDRPVLSSEKQSAEEWALTNGSEFMAAGLLAGITGNRADLLIIDDPVQNREAADSPTLQEKTYQEYIDTAMSRLKPRASAVIVMTRWHESDLCGAILPESWAGESGDIECRDGQTWRVVCVPAECERADDPLGRKPGEFIWPAWFGEGEKHWATWRNNPRAARTWHALYQQRPAPDVGLHFQRSMFEKTRYSLDAPRGYKYVD